MLNKNKVIVEFQIDGDESIDIIKSNISSDYPVITDLKSFINDRTHRIARESLLRLLDSHKITKVSDILNLQLALQLNDTIWIKQVDDGRVWEAISLYRNKFNQNIGNLGYDGESNRQYSVKLNIQPELTTDGSFDKCWIRDKRCIKQLKRGQEGFQNTGLEPYSEFYAQQVLEAFKAKHISYGLIQYRGKLAQSCEIFTDEQVGLLQIKQIDNDMSFENIVKMYERLGYMNELSDMLVADALILNQDRHLGNFGFLINNDTGVMIGTAPLYDHNLQLLPYAYESDLIDIDEYCNRVGVSPQIYDDFIYITRQFLTKSQKDRLNNMTDFRFRKHIIYNLQDRRLDRLNAMIRNQITKLLN